MDKPCSVFARDSEELMAERDAETKKIPFGAGTHAWVPAAPPGRQRVASDEIRLVMLLFAMMTRPT